MREDFFYRVHIIPIYLPPLRDRVEDIPLLIEHFLKIHSQHTQAPTIPGNMMEALLSHDWPGNVRELQNVLHRYYTLGKIDFLTSPPKSPERVFQVFFQSIKFFAFVKNADTASIMPLWHNL